MRSSRSYIRVCTDCLFIVDVLSEVDISCPHKTAWLCVYKLCRSVYSSLKALTVPEITFPETRPTELKKSSGFFQALSLTCATAA